MRKVPYEKGVPKKSELVEGSPVLRLTDEGLVQYVLYNNDLYRRQFLKEGEEEGMEITT